LSLSYQNQIRDLLAPPEPPALSVTMRW